MRKYVLMFAAVTLLVGMLTGSAWGFQSFATPTDYAEATGQQVEPVNEAPVLAAMVAAGELPPLAERLPVEPVVVEPSEEIGVYGGTLTTAASGPTWGGGDDWQVRAQFTFALMPDMTTVVPNIAKGWEWSDDLTSLTIYLREGMRWSDGHPFTTDDVMFWYEDIMWNEDLTPSHPTFLSPGGQFLEVERIDAYTFAFHFAVPYPPITNLLAIGQVEPYAPKHYLQQFHVNYNDDVDELANASGYEHWYELFSFHNSWNFGQQQQDPDRPCLYAWKMDRVDAAGNKYFSRNPYYWKIDTAGNQLPYMDNQIRTVVESVEVFGLQAMSGELTAAGQFLSLSDFPIYKDGEERGGYRVMLWDGSYGSNVKFQFNHTHQDPILREIFNDIRFRQAASLAIDRDEINETYFFGLATPRQATATPETRFFEPWMGEHYAEFDPDRANALLDEMGLEWDANRRYRLLPDGRTFSLTIPVVPGELREQVSTLVHDYWEDIGISIDIRTMDKTLSSERMVANELDLHPWDQSNASEFGMYTETGRMAPAQVESPAGAWVDWRNSGGELGEEPPQEVKRGFQLLDEWQRTLPGSDEYMELGREFLTLSVQNLWHIGTVGLSPQPVIIRSDVGNAPHDGIWGWEYRRFLPFGGDQWFYRP